jgi:hypothetical protein
MSTKTKVNDLWSQFRASINAAYAEASKANEEDGICLRDYAENISWSDDLAGLLGRESAEERRHRSNRPSLPTFSVDTAAKLLIMENARKGAEMSEMPRASAFLVLRKTAVESEVIGYIARKHLSAEWREAIRKLDYAELMKAGY